MTRPGGIRPGVRRLFDLALRKPSNVRDDIDEEIRFHLDERIAQLVARGMDPAVAQAEAERRFGNLAEAHDMLRRSAVQRESRLRVREIFSSWMQDLRFAWRALCRAPAFVTVAVACLAIGIGANVAIFSVIDGVLLKPLPFARPEQLVRVWNEGAVPPGVFTLLARDQKSYAGLAGYEGGREVSLTGIGEPMRLQQSATSITLFETLGVPPMLGRGFRTGDDQAGNEGVVVLNHALWYDRFGGDSSIVGRTVQIDGQTRRIVGVMPPSFRFPSPQVALWTPVRAKPGSAEYWWSTYLQLVGRLKPGVTVQGAQSELGILLPAARGAFPMRMPDEWGQNASVVSLRDAVTGSARPTLLLMIAAVGLVLLIACVNVATLYIGRASSRAREIAVRAALGGGRGRIVRLLLTESALVAGLGAAVGLALGAGAMRVLVSLLPSDTPRVGEIALDGRVLAFTVLLAALSALLFGLVPALRATRTDLASSLRGTNGSRGAGQSRSAAVLAVSQIALAVVLVSGAGLLIKSTYRLQHVPLGFATDNRFTASLPLPSFANDTAGRAPLFFGAVLDGLRATPGMTRVALASSLPFGDGIQNAAMAVEAHPTPQGAVPPTPALSLVSDAYFETLAIPVVRGRAFSAADRAGALQVAIVDETAAKTLWPTENAIGQRIRYVWNDAWYTVVGVVGAVTRDSLSGGPQPSLYLPMAQSAPRAMRLVAFTAQDEAAATTAIRAAIRAVDATVPLGRVEPLERVVAGSATRSRFTTFLFAIFAAVALLLGAVGIYGVISSGVARRTREIGVRMAIGATTSQISRMVLTETLRIAATGMLLGFAGAFATSRWIRGMLFGVDVADPWVLLSVTVLLAVVAVAAAVAPARRATRVDPLVAMRSD